MELQKLIRRLRSEKCPPSVLDLVAERIARESAQAPARSLRSSFAWAISITCCLLGLVGSWQWQARKEARVRATELAAQAQMEAHRAAVRQQTQEAFGYISQALLRATAQTEKALLKGAVPPLRNSFETVKTKVTKPI